MSGAQQLLAGGSSSSVTYVDDVFSSYLRTGTGASATVTNNIDLSTNGGLVWTKARSAATGHRFTDTARGATKSLDSSSTAAEATEAQGITSFSSTGYVVGTDTDYNNSTGPVTYVDWSFKKAAKFFDVVTYTGTGVARSISHSLGQTPGMVVIKRTSGTADDWYVWHRSLTSGYYIRLNLTDAQANSFSHTTFGDDVTTVDPTSTVFYVGSRAGVNANTATFVAYLFAHDTAADGIIQCGSFTTDGSGNATVNLGWEPQYLLAKPSSAVGGWLQMDTMRSWPNTASATALLQPNNSNAESTGNDYGPPTATGFNIKSFGASTTYIYLAIRRPNKPPTSGTEVFSLAAITGDGTIRRKVSTGFAPDTVLWSQRSNIQYAGVYQNGFWDRLRGAFGAQKLLSGSSTSAETAFGSDPDGIQLGVYSDGYAITGNGAIINTSGTSNVGYAFSRAPGVFDVVCYTGTGSATTVSHNLGVVPEMMIIKCRNTASTNWPVYHSYYGATYRGYINQISAFETLSNVFNDTNPTSSVFTVGTSGDTNTSTRTYVAYLFATKAGISKVFSYTGNGSSQTINCGFSAGARFILIKRTDNPAPTMEDWFVYDTARGINAGNDPHLSLNTTAAEVNTTDDIDSDNSGFIVNQNATTNLNVTSATYIGLAFA